MINIEYRMSNTTWFILITALVWFVYDVYAYVTEDVTTISKWITEFGYYSPIGPFIFGLLIGHFYWGPVKKDL